MAELFAPPHFLDSHRWREMRVGLLGGAFDPPHAGHTHISLIALKKLKLDAVWWLVSPNHPLKSNPMFDFGERLERCRVHTSAHSRIIITGLEQELGTSYTIDTVKRLQDTYSATAFVWLTGTENAQSLHKWKDWRGILDRIATAHMSRPPMESVVRNCPLKMLDHQTHIHVTAAVAAPLAPRTTFWITQERALWVSSTALRAQMQNG
jgi:nicotinate-nucleotide adenylyltransferase